MMSTTTQVVSSFSPLVFRACCTDYNGHQNGSRVNHAYALQSFWVLQLHAELP
uniref:Uncharacterized protein n=1 Tax=Arundo donax TaxID=35708 RepID=A0A0A9FYD3_ARUDO